MGRGETRCHRRETVVIHWIAFKEQLSGFVGPRGSLVYLASRMIFGIDFFSLRARAGQGRLRALWCGTGKAGTEED